MTILLLGAGPRVNWVAALLEALRARAAERPVPAIQVVTDPPTRESLVSLSSSVIDALVLVDHRPLTVTLPDTPPMEVVRAEAQRAVFAAELARRAVRTLVLGGTDTAGWPAALAELLAVPLPSGLPRPDQGLAPPAGAVSNLLPVYLEQLFAAAQRPPKSLTLAWPREAFLDGDAPGETLPATVEVAGRARILAYGPYLPLPSGDWHATTFLGFSPDIGKMPFILEADTGGTVSRGFFEVDRGGIFTLGLDFQVPDALYPVEMRLISQDSALEGQVALIEVRLEHSAR